MDGLRSMDDVVEGYRKTGVFHPSRWMLLRSDGVDVGVMILADHPQNDQWELVYLGLTPEARGRGFGQEATAFATRLALGARRSQMVLAVDRRNGPARRHEPAETYFREQSSGCGPARTDLAGERGKI